MPRPVAVVIQEFANVVTSTVATPAQGTCLIGRGVREVSVALGNATAMAYDSFFTDGSPAAVMPAGGLSDMKITSAKIKITAGKAYVEDAVASSNGDTAAVIDAVVGDLVYAASDLASIDFTTAQPAAKIRSIASGTATLTRTVTGSNPLVIVRDVSDVYLVQETGDLSATGLSTVTYPASPTVMSGESELDLAYFTSAYVEFIADRMDLSSTVTEVSASTYETVLGKATANNPLAMAAKLATLNMGAQTLYVVSTNGSTSADFAEALELLQPYPQIYTLVPLCETHAVAMEVASLYSSALDDRASHTLALESGIAQRFRIAVIGGLSVPSTVDVVSGATATWVSESSNDVTLNVASASFLTDAVVAGDTAVALSGGSTYTGTVISVPAENRIVVRLVNGSTTLASLLDGSGDPAVTLTVTHTLTKAQQAARAAAYNSFQSKRLYLAWQSIKAVDALSTTQTLGSQYLAATVGGLISALPPHAAISNLALSGIELTSPSYYTEAQLSLISDAGLLVFKVDRPGGAPFCIHGISTDTSGESRLAELSSVKVFDYTSTYFQRRQEAFLAGWNINDETIGFIKADLEIGISNLRSQKYAKLGPVILSAQITSVAQNPSVRDQLDSEILVTFPSPLNTLALRIVSQ